MATWNAGIPHGARMSAATDRKVWGSCLNRRVVITGMGGSAFGAIGTLLPIAST